MLGTPEKDNLSENSNSTISELQMISSVPRVERLQSVRVQQVAHDPRTRSDQQPVGRITMLLAQSPLSILGGSVQ